MLKNIYINSIAHSMYYSIQLFDSTLPNFSQKKSEKVARTSKVADSVKKHECSSQYKSSQRGWLSFWPGSSPFPLHESTSKDVSNVLSNVPINFLTLATVSETQVIPVFYRYQSLFLISKSGWGIFRS